MNVQIKFLFYDKYLIMSNFFLESVDKDDSLTTLNDTGDLTRMAYSNKSSDIPLRNSSMIDRFESDTFINHKESFENNNSRINSLNDEIRELKEKLKLVWEKDEEIQKLKKELHRLNLDLEGYTSLKDKYRIINDENSSLRIELDLLKVQELDLSKVKGENKLLKKKLLEITKESKTNKEYEISTDEFQGDPGEKISVDVPKLKSVLYSRLKTYHEKHIEDLIQQYDLTTKKEIDKVTMEKILLEAIHV
jgi:hypothetical protein